jgi:2-iminobutanoate/2-iminopropanoate deaminase
MTIQHIATSAAPSPGAAYSQAIIAGGFLYTAGMGPVDPSDGEVVPGGIREQTLQTLTNLTTLLAENGLDLTDVIKVTAHLSDLHRDFPEFDAAFRDVVPAPYPVRTTVGSTLWNILVEIDLIAKLRTDDQTPHRGPS